MRRRWVIIGASVTGILSLGLAVLGWAGAHDGYDWLAARCGRLPDIYPEWGWLFFVFPPAALGLLFSGLSLLMEMRIKPGARVVFACAVLCVLAAAAPSLMMAQPRCSTLTPSAFAP